MCTKFDIYIVIAFFFLIATHLIKKLFVKKNNEHKRSEIQNS
jgi:hypothetical protein